MIRTYKFKHNTDLTHTLAQTKITADLCVKERKHRKINKIKKSPTSADLIFAGVDLKSTIKDALIRKYYNNKKIKSIKKQPKIVFNHNNQKQIYIKNNILHLTPVKIQIDLTNKWFYMKNSNIKPLQVEIDETYIYLACEIDNLVKMLPISWIGVDLNATKDLAVLSDIKTGKVKKFGKQILHLYEYGCKKRQQQQQAGKRSKLYNTSRKTADLIKKIAVDICDYASDHNCGIRLENLSFSRKAKFGKKLNRVLSSFPFYKVKLAIENRAESIGIPVETIDSRYTSQACSRCGCIGSKSILARNKKLFSCVNCNHVDHADSNAAFNIGNLLPNQVVGAWAIF